MYYLIMRSYNKKESDTVIAHSYKKDRIEIEQLFIKYRDKYKYNKSYIKLYIKKV